MQHIYVYGVKQNHKVPQNIHVIMTSPVSVRAIFDIGKTNKKFLLFDENCSVVYNRQVTIDQAKDDDGEACEDLGRLVLWMKEEFNKAFASPKYRITALNVTTYGATLVHLDENNKVVTPLYNYLKPCPDDVMEAFYSKYGGREQLSLQTASPPMGLLNSGLQLYWLKQKKPEKYKKIACTLHFPQYLSHLFSGCLCSELTSIGCHTAMWNFQKGTYHHWIHKEGMKELLPGIQPVSSTCRSHYDGDLLQTGIGIHDSSAALAPFLFATEKAFIQLSTGTWSIAMNPFTSDPLTYEELENDCLHYINVHGKPVKASRLFLGKEYASQLKKTGCYFGRRQDRMDCQPDPELFKKRIEEKDPNRKMMVEKKSSSQLSFQGMTEGRDLSSFSSYEEACHQLMLDLVTIQLRSLKRIWGTTTIDRIIITGGFSKNDFFTRLLATFLPGIKVYTSRSSEASALGALLVMENNEKDPSFLQKLMGWRLHRPFENLNLEGYR